MIVGAGDFMINIWEGGYPVWCELKQGGQLLCKLRHSDLRDLEYTVNRAMKAAKSELPDRYKDEV